MPCPPEEENFDMFDSLKTKLPRTMRAILAAICVATSRAGGWLAADDFTSNGVTFKVQPYIPDGTSQAYPMTLCLHSSGSLGTDNAKQLGSGEPCYIWADWKAQREPTILVAPQLASGAWFEDPAASAVRELAKAYLNGTRSVGLAVNASRAFVTGHSNGAGGTWKLLDDDARLFAAASISDFFDPWSFDASLVAKTPQWVLSSSADTTVPTAKTLEPVTELWAAKGLPGSPDDTSDADLKWTLFDGDDAPRHGGVPQYIRATIGDEFLAWHYAH